LAPCSFERATVEDVLFYSTGRVKWVAAFRPHCRKDSKVSQINVAVAVKVAPDWFLALEYPKDIVADVIVAQRPVIISIYIAYSHKLAFQLPFTIQLCFLQNGLKLILQACSPDDYSNLINGVGIGVAIIIVGLFLPIYDLVSKVSAR